MRTLKDIASRGECTVVSTIHQPQSKIFQLFDNLLLMSLGDIVYQGEANKAIDFFDKAGFPCPPLTNPADHIIDVLADHHDTDSQSGHAHSIYDAKGHKFVVPVDPNYGGTKPFFALKAILPWYQQFAILFRRNVTIHWRSWEIFAMNIFVTLLIATFTSCSVWKNMGQNARSSSLRQPALFFCIIHQGIVASLQGSHSFPLERAIMLRERASGAYYVSAYFISKTAADFMFQVLSPTLFTAVVYPVIGFSNTAKQFFIFWAFMILTSMSATSLANTVSCICVSIELSTVVLAMAYEWVRLYGGWFISPAQMSTFPQWYFADALSYIKYGFVGVSLNENNGLWLKCLPTDCAPATCATDHSCKMPPLTAAPFTGEAIEALYGYNRYTIDFCAGMLIVYIIVARLLAYLGLRFIKI
jgi:ABC-2 type transporter